MELMLTTAELLIKYSSSGSDAAPAFNKGKKALVNISGDMVLTAKVSAICSDETKFMRVDLGETPALLISKFNPCSPTRDETSSAMSGKVS